MTMYRLNESISGVQLDSEADHPVMVRLPAGTIVTLADQAAPSGLVNIEAAGKTITVFLADLEERSIQVQAAS